MNWERYDELHAHNVKLFKLLAKARNETERKLLKSKIIVNCEEAERLKK